MEAARLTAPQAFLALCLEVGQPVLPHQVPVDECGTSALVAFQQGNDGTGIPLQQSASRKYQPG